MKVCFNASQDSLRLFCELLTILWLSPFLIYPIDLRLCDSITQLSLFLRIFSKPSNDPDMPVLCQPWLLDVPDFFILKLSIMRSESYQVERKEQIEKANLWDPFVTHINSLYFSGAIDLLDKQTIAFEYDHFRSYFTRG